MPLSKIVANSITDNTITSSQMFSGFKNGITFAQTWRFTQNQAFTGGGATIFSAGGWEAQDTDSEPSYGSNMTASSGIFSFPSTGIYRVDANIYFRLTSSTNDMAFFEVYMQVTTNNSSYSNTAIFLQSISNSNDYAAMSDCCLIDVTDTSNVKFKMTGYPQSGHNVTVTGDSDGSYTSLTFTRLGDT